MQHARAMQHACATDTCKATSRTYKTGIRTQQRNRWIVYWDELLLLLLLSVNLTKCQTISCTYTLKDTWIRIQKTTSSAISTFTDLMHQSKTDMFSFKFHSECCPQIANWWIRHCNIDMQRLPIFGPKAGFLKSRSPAQPGSITCIWPVPVGAHFGSRPWTPSKVPFC